MTDGSWGANLENPSVGKVLLVIPPCFLNPELDFEIGFPVHLLLLGKAVREEGWSVEYVDMTLEEKEGFDSFAELEKRLADPEIKLVGISNHTVRTSVTTKAIARRIKSLRPDTRIVVGGVNATFMWRELLTECEAIDFVLRGYAQAGLRALLKMLRNGSAQAVPGLAARHGNDFRLDTFAPVIIADLSTPSFDGLPIARYLGWTTTYPLLTHTGCGFSCNFCTSVMPGPYQNREVHRPAEDVVAEMVRALESGFDRFFMSANVFTSQKERCLKLCRAIQDAGIHERASWVCMTRVEFVDGELLRAMRAAGCENVAFGVETASPDQWKSLRKGYFSEETICNAFRLTKDAGVGTSSFLMLGAPSQTQDDIDATAKLVREIDPDYRVVSFFQPFPGTPYWERREELGLSEIAPFEDWNFHEGPICRTKHLSKADLINAAIRFYIESTLMPSGNGSAHIDGTARILRDNLIARHPRTRLISLYRMSKMLRTHAGTPSHNGMVSQETERHKFKQQKAELPTPVRTGNSARRHSLQLVYPPTQPGGAAAGSQSPKRRQSSSVKV
jgi:radical SAM superfamily enzyme YgiQ (UPF0313 family)